MESTLEKLQKEIKQAQHIKDVLDERVKKLSEEELQYLSDIPKFKKQAENERAVCEEIVNKSNVFKSQLSAINNELKEKRDAILKANEDMEEISHNSKLVTDSIHKQSVECVNRIDAVKKREVDANSRENLIQAKENELEKIKSDIDSKNDKLNISMKRWEELRSKNEKDLESLEQKKSELDKRENLFNENRKSAIQQEEILKDKIQDSDRIIKNNTNLTAELELKKSDLNKEISKSATLQESLSRNISELENEKKRIKIMELRVKKMAHDSGLDKELQELEESLK